MEQGLEGGCPRTELLIRGLMLFGDHSASICNQRSQNLQMF